MKCHHTSVETRLWRLKLYPEKSSKGARDHQEILTFWTVCLVLYNYKILFDPLTVKFHFEIRPRHLPGLAVSAPDVVGAHGLSARPSVFRFVTKPLVFCGSLHSVVVTGLISFR
eukprot:g77608.t1